MEKERWRWHALALAVSLDLTQLPSEMTHRVKRDSQWGKIALLCEDRRNLNYSHLINYPVVILARLFTSLILRRSFTQHPHGMLPEPCSRERCARWDDTPRRDMEPETRPPKGSIPATLIENIWAPFDVPAELCSSWINYTNLEAFLFSPTCSVWAIFRVKNKNVAYQMNESVRNRDNVGSCRENRCETL